MVPRSSFLISLVALAFLGGCNTDKIYVTVVRPGVIDLGRYRTVAVDHLQGQGGTDLAEELTVCLTSARNPLTSRKSIQVVDRRNYDRIMAELKRQRGDLWDQATIVQLGRLAGAKALIHGRISIHRYSEEVHRKVVEDLNQEKHTNFTRIGTARVAAYIQVADTETGRVLDSMKFDRQLGARTKAQDRMPPRIDGDQLLARLRRQIALTFCKRVFPHPERVAVRLYKDGDFPALEVGNNYAAMGSWKKAVDQYRAALARMAGKLAEYRHMALFNLGVALEYQDRFDEAREVLQEAYALSGERRIMQELANLKRREAEFLRLNSQGAGSGME